MGGWGGRTIEFKGATEREQETSSEGKDVEVGEEGTCKVSSRDET